MSPHYTRVNISLVFGAYFTLLYDILQIGLNDITFNLIFSVYHILHQTYIFHYYVYLSVNLHAYLTVHVSLSVRSKKSVIVIICIMSGGQSGAWG